MIRHYGGWLFVLLLALGPVPALAQTVEPYPQVEQDEALKVFLVTIGQGDLVYERFGHNALLFQDEGRGLNVAYHWGVFSFDQVDFVPRLIRGTMLYGMGRADPDTMLRDYQWAGRPVWLQELELSPAQRWELLSLVEENYRPENREYRYDYYRDNCSTRIRDLLDRVLDGQIAAQFAADSTSHSYRWHTRRVLRDMPGYYLGIQFVLGPNGDGPITVWDEMFLPPTLMEAVREVRVSEGEGGGRPLVSEERTVLESHRSAPPLAPPFALPIFLAFGVLWGVALFRLTGKGSGLSLGRRMGVSLLAGGWSLLAAIGGTLLLGAWLYTDHFFWYANYNLFQVNPLFLPLPAAFLFFLFTGRFPRWAKGLAAFLGVASLIGLALELIPGLGQRNAEILGLTLPVNLALWAAATRLRSGENPAAAGTGQATE